MAEKFASHLLVGLFLGAFGLTFLGLAVYRLVRLVDNLQVREEEEIEDDQQIDDDLLVVGVSTRNNVGKAKEEVGRLEVDVLLREFLHRHVPEQNTSFLRATSIAISASCIFGIVYTMLGSHFFNHNLHPEYTLFHYITHLTLLMLYLFVGWTGLLETYWYLPTDSLRSATAIALWGETVLWTQHGASKTDDLDANLHYSIGGIAGLTGVLMTASVLMGQHQQNHPTFSFVLYVGSLVGYLWQGLWFVTVAIYIQGWLPIPSTSHATALVVVEGLLLLVGCQLIAMCLVNRITRNRYNSQNIHHHCKMLHQEETRSLVAGEKARTRTI